jgi:outer membrane murein-binding lipoprotein Lpp
MVPSRRYLCAALCLLLASGCGPSEREQKLATAQQNLDAEKAKLEQLKAALRQVYARVETDKVELNAWVKARGDELTKTYQPGDELKAKFAELFTEENRKRAENNSRTGAESSRLMKEIQAQSAQIKAAEAAHRAAFTGK